MSKFCAIYARQSIDKADSISIETQIERCIREVDNTPYKIYEDRGYSGKDTERPGFQTMLDDVRNDLIRCVICYKLDRCSRSILDFAQLMDTLQQQEVAFISCTEKFDTTTPMGRAMLNICIVFAQLERETIQQRITDAYHSRCKKGFYMGGRIPFGFTLIPHLLEGKKTARYRIHETEAEILKQIYLIYKGPDTSLSDVVLGLMAQNIKNPRREDGLWIRPHISRVIKNPIYVRADPQIYDYFAVRETILDNPREDYIGYNGCYLYHIGSEQHLVLAPHEGIIPADIWLKCQNKKKTQSKRRKEYDHSTWLTGKMKCGICGRAVAIRQSTGKNGRTYRYFLCSGARGRDRRCNGFHPTPAQVIENIIQKEICERILQITRHMCLHPPEQHESEALADALQNLAESCKNSRIPITQLQSMLLDLGNQMSAPIDEQSSISDDDLKRLNTHLSHWHHITMDQKGQIADLLISKMELSNNQIKIYWRV